MKRFFFSFYNIFFYTDPVYLFHFLRDFCNVHDNIVAFFSFLFLERFQYFSRALFVDFLYFLVKFLDSFIYLKKKL